MKIHYEILHLHERMFLGGLEWVEIAPLSVVASEPWWVIYLGDAL